MTKPTSEEPSSQTMPNRAHLAAFIAQLQADASGHIAFFGTQVDDIASDLGMFLDGKEGGFAIRYDGDQIVGFMGVEYDLEIGRAWIYGPLVKYQDWQEMADQLFAEVQTSVIPPEINACDMFIDVANTNAASFAERHGFERRPPAANLRLGREKSSSLPEAEAPELSPDDHQAFVRLHEGTFPRTNHLGHQIIEQLDVRHKVFVARENGLLQGYIYAKIDPAAENGYISFLGVDEPARRRGIGRRLIIAATRWLFTFPEISEVILTVNADNNAAMALYQQIGFEFLRTLVSFRKTIRSEND